MADVPVGLSDKEIIRSLAVIEANLEASNVPPPQRQVILDRARAQMELKPAVPDGGSGPPP